MKKELKQAMAAYEKSIQAVQKEFRARVYKLLDEKAEKALTPKKSVIKPANVNKLTSVKSARRSRTPATR